MGLVDGRKRGGARREDRDHVGSSKMRSLADPARDDDIRLLSQGPCLPEWVQVRAEPQAAAIPSAHCRPAGAHKPPLGPDDEASRSEQFRDTHEHPKVLLELTTSVQVVTNLNQSLPLGRNEL